MRIIRETKTAHLPEDNACRFFVQIWYSMVHRNSLDSHRVRCMNSLNILNELSTLISRKEFPGIDNDIGIVASEAKSILEKDRIVSGCFPKYFQLVEPLLGNIETTSDKKKKNQSTMLLSYYLKDFLAVLKTQYKKNILVELEKAVFTTKSEEDIFDYTGTLLSVLIDEGHSIEELFGIIQNIFVNNKSKKTFSFKENFEFAKNIIDHSDYEYEIVFRLEGFRKTEYILPDVAGIFFENKPIVSISDERVKAFLSPGQNVLFSRKKVKAQDDRSAGSLAKKYLDEVLDLIRFELEQEFISISQEFVAIRFNDDSARVFRLPSQIPNPNKNIDTVEFESFMNSVTNILQSHNLERESTEKIKSSFRFYRMGRDTDQFENKFMNWWTALEYLVRTGEQGSIVGEIEKRLVSMLILNYTGKHLNSYKNTLFVCGVKPSDKTQKRLEIEDYRDIKLYDFFSIIHDQSEYDSIIKGLSSYPALKFYLEKFRNQTNDIKTLKHFVNQHENHLRWHINRIWRTRCDIVHSAEYSINLILLSANLEYYLKYVLSAILQKLSANKTINSLKELFDRIEYDYSCFKNSLEKGDPTFHEKLLKNGTV